MTPAPRNGCGNGHLDVDGVGSVAVIDTVGAAHLDKTKKRPRGSLDPELYVQSAAKEFATLPHSHLTLTIIGLQIGLC